jgi:hypothetical protein
LKKHSRTSSLIEAVESSVKQQHCMYILGDAVVQDLHEVHVSRYNNTCIYANTYKQMELAYILMISHAICILRGACTYGMRHSTETCTLIGMLLKYIPIAKCTYWH